MLVKASFPRVEIVVQPGLELEFLSIDRCVYSIYIKQVTGGIYLFFTACVYLP